MIAPRYNDDHQWQKPAALVPATMPGKRLLVEVGPGRGEFLWHLARTEADAHIIGIEIGTPRFLRLRRDSRPFPHVSLIYGDARIALSDLAMQNCIDCLYINFPDPWPKRKHARHRLMQPDFIDACIRALKTGGELRFTTDWPDYAESTNQQLLAHSELEPLHAGGYATENPDVFPTHFYEKWTAMGRTIHYLYYRKHS